MYLDKSEFSPFYGTGEKNEKGETLEEFLEAYDPKKYDCPCNTVDMLIFRQGEPMKLLLIKRRNHPSIGDWAVPGGFVDVDESLYEAAKRELLEETGIDDVPFIQLRTWGDPKRDPRWRVITTAYLAFIERDITATAGDDAKDALWFDVDLTVPEHGKEGLLSLRLQNDEAGITLHAEIDYHQHHAGSLLSEPSYTILSKQGLASDHCLLIADALLTLRKKIKEKESSIDVAIGRMI